MTCIVGLVDKGTVWMGGDSASCSGWDLTIRKDPKVFRAGGMLVGGTSSWRMLQLLRFGPGGNPHPLFDALENPDCDAFEWMVCRFIPWARDIFTGGGFVKKENQVESGGTFLVGLAGRLFRVDDDFQVSESVHGFDACGSGEQVARGALAALDRQFFPKNAWQPVARERVEMALVAAEKFSAGVRGPFTILSLENGNA